MIYSDRELSRRLERTEARANADFVETRARLNPGYGAEWIEVAGTYAMFDGVESPLTQTFGLGMFEEATADQLEQLEAFFIAREAPVFHEVSPMADPSLLELLNSRGYRPIELTSIMYRTLGAPMKLAERSGVGLTTRLASGDETALWAKTSAEAWATEHAELGEFMLNFGSVSAQCSGAFPFLCELDGDAVSTGSLLIYDDVCILAGASTIKAARNRGAQNALLSARLSYAVEQGCELAMMGAAPGSQSQRNAQKNGFHIAYTRIKWQLTK